jgi:hypothetical protein
MLLLRGKTTEQAICRDKTGQAAYQNKRARKIKRALFYP